MRGFIAGKLRGPEADELVQGVGNRSGGPGQHLADLVRGEGRAGELAQGLRDQAAESPAPGGRGSPPPGAALPAGMVKGGRGAWGGRKADRANGYQMCSKLTTASERWPRLESPEGKPSAGNHSLLIGWTAAGPGCGIVETVGWS